MGNKIFSASDARRLAKRRLPRMIFDFIDGSAGEERACALNVETIEALRMLPRVLINVEDRSYQKTLFDQNWNLPFGIAPMGMCDLTWPGADAMLARAARHYGIPLVLSTMSSSSIETTAERAGEHAWFQLYVGQSEEVAYHLIERAETVGYTNLILTVDVPSIGSRPREERNGFQSPFRIGPRQFLDFALHPQWSLTTLKTGMPRLANVNVPGGQQFKRNEARGLVDWDFLARLRERWPGNLIVKGVLDCEDAVRIRDAGVDAVCVSNHGGRQLDSVPAAIQMLPRIREAVGVDFPLLFDSGVRNGEGVLKALASGADFVLIGRPFLYAMAADGYPGLQQLIELFRSQIDNSLAQLGCRDIDNIDSSYMLNGLVASTGVEPE
ncbi:MAG: alpha-hydroxy-acid oxidizing protein [Gammaproteobacteria bacterium]|nr:alpha-hydroxy-acid oxidizing protein [Gammaproteobacteria bacterium]